MAEDIKIAWQNLGRTLAIQKHSETFVIPHVDTDRLFKDIDFISEYSEKCNLNATLVGWADIEESLEKFYPPGIGPADEVELPIEKEQASSANLIRKSIMDMTVQNLKEKCKCRESEK